MSVINNTRIVGPVSIRDVQRVVGLSSTDLKTLCTSRKIAMWAKFRPVEYKSTGISGTYYVKQIPDASRANVFYGIAWIPLWANRVIGHMLNFWTNVSRAYVNIPDSIDENGVSQTHVIPSDDTYWKMTLPSSVARITDFVSSVNPTTKGYFHSAQPPIGPMAVSSLEVKPNGQLSFEFTKNEGGVSEGLTITYEDLSTSGIIPGARDIYQMYFGVAMSKLNSSGTPTNTFYYLTQSTPLSSFQSMGATVHTVITSESFAGRYRVFPFVSSGSLPSGQTQGTTYPLETNANAGGSGYSFIALLECQEVSISIKYAKIEVSAFSIWRNSAVSSRHVYYSVTLTNTESDESRGYKLDITFFKSDGLTIVTTKTVTGQIAAGQTIDVTGSQDVTEAGFLPSDVGAARVICTVYDAHALFRESSSAVTNECPDGPIYQS